MTLTLDILNEAGLKQGLEHLNDIARRLRMREQRAAEQMVKAEADLNDARKLLAFAQIYHGELSSRLQRIEEQKK